MGSFLRQSVSMEAPSAQMHVAHGSHGQLSLRRIGHRTNYIEFPENYSFKDTLKMPPNRAMHTKTPNHFPYKADVASFGSSRFGAGVQISATRVDLYDIVNTRHKSATPQKKEHRGIRSERSAVKPRDFKLDLGGHTCRDASLPAVRSRGYGSDSRLPQVRGSRPQNHGRELNQTRRVYIRDSGGPARRLSSVTSGSTPVFVSANDTRVFSY